MIPEAELRKYQAKHLGMVQDIIKRMAQNSFVVKGWSVTLFAVIFAIVRSENASRSTSLIVLVPTLIFWGLDAFYLRQERLFRTLHNFCWQH